MSRLRVLVTGGSGFIGSNLVYKLLTHGDVGEVYISSRRPHGYLSTLDNWRVADLVQEAEVERLLADTRPDVIFHLAANPIIRADDRDPFRIMHTNVLATHYLLEYCQPGTRFVLASSAAVYGDRAYWAQESQACSPSSVYGATKVAAESLLQAYHNLGKVRGLALRLTANVGHGATHGVVFDLLRKLRSESPTLDLLGDEPGSAKHYTHVEDTVAAFLELGLNPSVSGVVNIATDDVLNVAELARLVMEGCGIHKPVRWLGEAANWAGDNRLVSVDTSWAWRLGWKPSYHRSAGAVLRGVADLCGF